MKWREDEMKKTFFSFLQLFYQFFNQKLLNWPQSSEFQWPWCRRIVVCSVQQLLRTAIIAAELGETKKNLSLSTGDNEEGGFVDFVDLETRIHLNKLSLIPVMVKHSFSIGEQTHLNK